ncbi:hypothetical protein [Mesorhizobium sp. KR2-14]|uniref:hypothetical protein n=1 Tax=Mesorhizobium sp. KR2-14 TaxID=3156610 RepID=UPI0032B4201A
MTWGDLGAVAQTLITIGGSVGATWWAIHRRISTVERRVEEVRSKGAHELAEFKLAVAEKYATHEALKEIEERIVGAISRLGDRLDKIVDRNQISARRRGGAD